MPERITLTEAADQAKISRDKARYWLGLLDVEATRDGRNATVPAWSVDLLRPMVLAVKNGQAPAVAATEVKATFAVPTETPAPEPTQGRAEDDRIEGIERAIMALTDHVKGLSTRIEALTIENRQLRARLEPPADRDRDFLPWRPPALKDPLSGLPWWRKAWVRITAPERCRRIEN